MLQMFYYSVVGSVIFYAVVCWGSGVKTADANSIKLIKRAASVMGVELESLLEVSERRILRKLLCLIKNVLCQGLKTTIIIIIIIIIIIMKE
ncbi:hypothetical protein QTP70_006663 [Hemibagrus guttatus]|uniref:Uncharacterized protein n=1 Tax=Hemibagrus guttatus TaxID=175788 RepID=A0AAE0QFR6_9TELE|nr:hypothetical protein QTP70_006663 [Hemibagrus guttatus]